MKRVRLFVLLSLVSGGAVAGQAPPLSSSAAISGTVRDGVTAVPLAGAIVALRFPSNMPATPGLARIQRQVTDASGRFVFRGLPAGQGYTLAASRPGYGDGAYGQTMVAVVTFSDVRTQLSGRITTHAGAPGDSLFIAVFPADRSLWRAQSRRITSARADTDGRWVIAGLPPGDYLVVALTDLAPGELWDVALLEQLVPAGVAVSLKDGEQKTQDFTIGKPPQSSILN